MNYSLTRILAELKLLDRKIIENTNTGIFVDLRQKKAPNTVVLKKSEDKATADIKADYESIQKLIANRTALKAALVKANAETTLTIAGKVYTIAEAIEEKTTIRNLEALLNNMRRQKIGVQASQTQMDDKTEASINALLTANLSSAKNTEKYTESTMKAIGDPLREENKVILIDPLGIDKEIETLSSRIDAFTTEVDFALSEINARTTVEVNI